MKRITALILVLLMLAPSLSCGTQTSENTDTTTSETTTALATTDENDPGLPPRDFDGYTFTFAGRGAEGDPYKWNNTDIIAEEQNGDVLNDAVYNRNAYMKDTYNVNIDILFCGGTGVNTTGSEMYQFINKSVMSGDKEFDAILSSAFDSVGYVTSGFVIDLNTLENVDFTRSYWDQTARETLKFGNKYYITTGDVTYVDNKSTHVILFNKDLAEDYKIENPYEVVKSGKWTVDRFIADAKSVTRDLNGDGVMTKDDLFGFTYWQDAAFCFINSTGNKIGEIDKNGEPQLTLNTERMANTWEKMIAFLETDTAYAEYPNRAEFPNDKTLDIMFGENHALYAWALVHSIIQLRSLDVNFGILPVPKYDEAQEEYITTPGAYGHTMLTVPVTMSDRLDETGFILEAFAAKSADIVTPAFYDKTLIGKSTRDDESAEMLDLIFKNRYYDIGYFFSWGNYVNVYMQAWNDKNPNFASLYEANEAKALEDISRISEIFN